MSALDKMTRIRPAPSPPSYPDGPPRKHSGRTGKSYDPVNFVGLDEHGEVEPYNGPVSAPKPRGRARTPNGAVATGVSLCPACGKPVTGRKTYCNAACRANAYRRRAKK